MLKTKMNSIRLTGPITSDCFSEFKNTCKSAILKCQTRVHVYIDSKGGDINVAYNIINLMKELHSLHNIVFIGYIDSEAYSAAALIYLCCDIKFYNTSSKLYLHLCKSNEKNMTDYFNKFVTSIVEIYDLELMKVYDYKTMFKTKAIPIPQILI